MCRLLSIRMRLQSPLNSILCLTRVLPSKSPRFCLTVWMSEAQTRSPVSSPAQIRARASLKLHAQNGGDLPDDIAAILLRDPEVLRHIGRLRHCIEWAKSIKVLRQPHFSSFVQRVLGHIHCFCPRNIRPGLKRFICLIGKPHFWRISTSRAGNILEGN